MLSFQTDCRAILFTKCLLDGHIIRCRLTIIVLAHYFILHAILIILVWVGIKYLDLSLVF